MEERPVPARTSSTGSTSFRIGISALRERAEDIPRSSATTSSRSSIAVRRAWSRACRPRCARMSAQYDWPGNVRELRNMIETIYVGGPSWWYLAVKDLKNGCRRSSPVRAGRPGRERTAAFGVAFDGQLEQEQGSASAALVADDALPQDGEVQHFLGAGRLHGSAAPDTVARCDDLIQSAVTPA